MSKVTVVSRPNRITIASKGVQGAPGPTGPQGEQGIQGPKGDTGDVTPEALAARDAAVDAADAASQSADAAAASESAAGGSATTASAKADEAAASADLAEQARLLGATIGFATKADMDASLAHPAGTLAMVTSDATAANNGAYRKTGASGSGSWVQSADRVTGLEGRVGAAEVRASDASQDATRLGTSLEYPNLFTLDEIEGRDNSRVVNQAQRNLMQAVDYLGLKAWKITSAGGVSVVEWRFPRSMFEESGVISASILALAAEAGTGSSASINLTLRQMNSGYTQVDRHDAAMAGSGAITAPVRGRLATVPLHPDAAFVLFRVGIASSTPRAIWVRELHISAGRNPAFLLPDPGYASEEDLELISSRVDDAVDLTLLAAGAEVSSPTGTLDIPTTSAATPLRLTISGRTVNHMDVESGSLDSTEVASIESRDSAGEVVGLTEYSPAVVLRDAGELGGAARDTLESSGLVTRRVGSITVTGDQPNIVPINSHPNIETLGIAFGPISAMKIGSRLPGRCDRLPVGAHYEPDVEGVQLGAGNNYIYLRINRSRLVSQDLAGIRAWLDANPLTIYFERAEYVHESLPPADMTSVPGGTVVVNSSVPPRAISTRLLGIGGASNPWAMGPDSKIYMVSQMPDAIPSEHEGVYAAYDDIAARHPSYVSSQVLGMDAWGNEIREYAFTEPATENDFGFRKLRFGIITGVHGNEKTTAIGLERFMRSLASNEGGSDLLRRLRAAVDFYVIPMVTPTGWDANSRFNANNVNINRNFTTNWDEGSQNPGSSPASELETQTVEAWMADRELDYFIDFHWFGATTVENNLISWVAVPNGSVDADELRRMYADSMNHLSVYWADRYSEFPRGVNFGRAINYTSNLAQSQVQAATTGARSMVLEVASPINYFDSSVRAGSTLACTAELVGNVILRMTRDSL